MKSVGEFIFRGIERKDGGNFINDKGETISYKPSFKLKVDEEIDNKTYERIFKIPETNVTLADDFRVLDNYTKIRIQFDVQIYGSRVNLVPEDVQVI